MRESSPTTAATYKVVAVVFVSIRVSMQSINRAINLFIHSQYDLPQIFFFYYSTFSTTALNQGISMALKCYIGLVL